MPKPVFKNWLLNFIPTLHLLDVSHLPFELHALLRCVQVFVLEDVELILKSAVFASKVCVQQHSFVELSLKRGIRVQVNRIATNLIHDV